MRDRLFRITGIVMMVLGAGILALVAAYWGYGLVAQARINAQIAQQTPQVKEEPPAFLPRGEVKPLVGSPDLPSATWIKIPSIEVDSKVVELGTVLENGQLVYQTPDHAVGHYIGSADAGETGNVVMYGHISSPLKGEGNVFRRLPEIKPGDEVFLTSAAGRFTYVVVKTVIVTPDRTDVMDQTQDARLTLLTCYPDWVYSHRFIAVAMLTAFEPAVRGL